MHLYLHFLVYIYINNILLKKCILSQKHSNNRKNRHAYRNTRTLTHIRIQMRDPTSSSSTHTHTGKHPNIKTQMHRHIHKYAHVYSHLYAYVYVCLCVHTPVYVCARRSTRNVWNKTLTKELVIIFYFLQTLSGLGWDGWELCGKWGG